jgi:hypothetical protein
LLPNELVEQVSSIIDQGSSIMKATLEQRRAA